MRAAETATREYRAPHVRHRARASLEDLQVHAFTEIMATLRELPDARARARVLRWVLDWTDHGADDLRVGG